jgi:hypothetical protein
MLFFILLFITLTTSDKLFTLTGEKVVRLLLANNQIEEFLEILGAIFSLIPEICKIFSDY